MSNCAHLFPIFSQRHSSYLKLDIYRHKRDQRLSTEKDITRESYDDCNLNTEIQCTKRMIKMKERSNFTKQVNGRFFLVSTIISFLTISFALITLGEHPITGYEISIYSSTPWIFWFAVILGILNGIFLFYCNYGYKKLYWTLGLFQIILCNSMIIALFALRGFFYLERYDSLSYVGYAKDLIMQGFIPQYNFYPMTSILLSSIGQLTNVSILGVLVFFPAAIFALYIISLFAWSKTISGDPKFVTSMMLASLPIFYAWFIPSIYHESLCILLLPFFFFCLHKRKNGDRRFKSISSMLMIVLILWHPLVAVAGIIYLQVRLFYSHLLFFLDG
jgi:hypothetical protein